MPHDEEETTKMPDIEQHSQYSQLRGCQKLPPHFYEVIADATTHLFFKIERPFNEIEQAADLDALRGIITSALLRNIEALLCEVYGIDNNTHLSFVGLLRPGSNCQLAVSEHTDKYMCRLVIYMQHGSCTVQTAATVAGVLSKRLANMSPTDPDHSLLVYKKNIDYNHRLQSCFLGCFDDMCKSKVELHGVAWSCMELP